MTSDEKKHATGLGLGEDSSSTTSNSHLAQPPPAMDEKGSRSPRTHIDSSPLPTDSMVTVALSETDGASTTDHGDGDEEGATDDDDDDDNNDNNNDDEEGARESVTHPAIVVGEQPLDSSSTTLSSSRTTSREIHDAFGARRRDSDGSGSGSSETVDWAELEKKEEQEPASEEEVRVYYACCVCGHVKTGHSTTTPDSFIHTFIHSFIHHC